MCTDARTHTHTLHLSFTLQSPPLPHACAHKHTHTRIKDSDTRSPLSLTVLILSQGQPTLCQREWRKPGTTEEMLSEEGHYYTYQTTHRQRAPTTLIALSLSQVREDTEPFFSPHINWIPLSGGDSKQPMGSYTPRGKMTPSLYRFR